MFRVKDAGFSADLECRAFWFRVQGVVLRVLHFGDCWQLEFRFLAWGSVS